MNYKDYSITNFSKWGYFEAYNLNDLDEPLIKHKSLKEVKKIIDLKLKK